MVSTLAHHEITAQEARKRTEKHKKDFSELRSTTRARWATIAREVQESVNLGVPEKVNMPVRGWLAYMFEESVSTIYDYLARLKELKHIPVKQLDAMPRLNSKQLMRLPQKLRTAKVIEQAVEMKPKEFKPIVDEIREKKLGIKPEPWKTYAITMPIAVYEATIASDEKLARVLQVDISEALCAADFTKWTKNRVMVAEAKAQLINLTDESRLRVEIEGDNQEDEAVPEG